MSTPRSLLRARNGLALSMVLGGALVVAAPPPPAAAQLRYIAFGDSITEGFGDESPAFDGEGYPARLEALLRERGVSASVDNFGLGGEDTVEAMGRVNSVLNAGGDVFLLMEGTNDITNNISPETTLENLREMARRGDLRGFRVVHGTLIPRLPNVAIDYRNVITQRLAQSIRDLAGFQGRRVADAFEVFSNQTSLYTRLYTPSKGSEDPVGHPNAVGYDLLARVFADVETARDNVGPVAGLSNPRAGATQVAANAPLLLDVWDLGSELDVASLRLVVNGAEVTPVRDGSGDLVTLGYAPPTPWTGVVRVGLRGRDTASPANETNKEVLRFVVAGTQLLTGDIDQDGRVDGEDLVTFALHFGQRKTSSNHFFAAADFDASGEINGVDLAALAANFGRSVN
jgi:lysophospholipase L1-like esterase